MNEIQNVSHRWIGNCPGSEIVRLEIVRPGSLNLEPSLVTGAFIPELYQFAF